MAKIRIADYLPEEWDNILIENEWLRRQIRAFLAEHGAYYTKFDSNNDWRIGMTGEEVCRNWLIDQGYTVTTWTEDYGYFDEIIEIILKWRLEAGKLLQETEDDGLPVEDSYFDYYFDIEKELLDRLDEYSDEKFYENVFDITYETPAPTDDPDHPLAYTYTDIELIRNWYFDEYDLNANGNLYDVKTAHARQKPPQSSWRFYYPIEQTEHGKKDYAILVYLGVGEEYEDLEYAYIMGWMSIEEIRKCPTLAKGSKSPQGTTMRDDNFETRMRQWTLFES